MEESAESILKTVNQGAQEFGTVERGLLERGNADAAALLDRSQK